MEGGDTVATHFAETSRSKSNFKRRLQIRGSAQVGCGGPARGKSACRRPAAEFHPPALTAACAMASMLHSTGLMAGPLATGSQLSSRRAVSGTRLVHGSSRRPASAREAIVPLAAASGACHLPGAAVLRAARHRTVAACPAAGVSLLLSVSEYGLIRSPLALPPGATAARACLAPRGHAWDSATAPAQLTRGGSSPGELVCYALLNNSPPCAPPPRRRAAAGARRTEREGGTSAGMDDAPGWAVHAGTLDSHVCRALAALPTHCDALPRPVLSRSRTET